MYALRHEDRTEAMVVAELYHQFRKRDIKCLLEQKFMLENDDVKDYMFADMSIYDEEKSDEPILNIEVKNHSSARGLTQLWTKRDYLPTKQLKRYISLGIPVFYCENWDSIEQTVNFVENWFDRDLDALYRKYPNKIPNINKHLHPNFN
jgi:hypothetical protein